MSLLTRFAPSPTGFLHMGHALSALEVWGWARANDATVLLRIEDIDHLRCRSGYEAAIFEDLAWLGLQWPEPVLRQSHHISRYREIMDRLRTAGLIYPCFCTRSEIRNDAVEAGHEGPIYGGRCRRFRENDAEKRIADGEPAAWRLKLDEALASAGDINWTDSTAGPQHWDGQGWGDVVLARKDIGLSYHVAVTADDATQSITDVVRGEDLFQATHIHVVLQRLMGWSTPSYHHHRLLLDDGGTKLSKRTGAERLRDIADQMGGRDAFLDHLRELGVSSSFFDHLGTVSVGPDE